MTNAAKHTPGPWTTVEHSWEETSVCSGSRALCTVFIHPDVTEKTQDKWESEMDGNARLIAAAPELLAALQRSHEVLFAMHEAEAHPKAKKLLADQLTENTIAIAKATS